MRAWSRHRPDGAMLRAVTIVNASIVCCVQSKPGRCNAAGERVLCTARDREDDARREASRFADQSTPTNHSWSSCITPRFLGGCARYRALWAPAECALRRPCGRTEGVACGTDVRMSTYACAIPASTIFE